jgi:hypothetical protein
MDTTAEELMELMLEVFLADKLNCTLRSADNFEYSPRRNIRLCYGDKQRISI